jgi:hypothetical protein
MNSYDKATSSGKIGCDCNCSELVNDITAIINSFECKKMEKMEMKLCNERKTSKFYRLVLFVYRIMFFAYFKVVA